MEEELNVLLIEMESAMNIIKITKSWDPKIAKKKRSDIHTKVDMSARIKL